MWGEGVYQVPLINHPQAASLETEHEAKERNNKLQMSFPGYIGKYLFVYGFSFQKKL